MTRRTSFVFVSSGEESSPHNTSSLEADRLYPTHSLYIHTNTELSKLTVQKTVHAQQCIRGQSSALDTFLYLVARAGRARASVRVIVSVCLAMSKQTTRKGRRRQRREIFFTGEARHPYRHATSLDSALAETGETGASVSGSPNDTDVCAQCKPVLSRYVDTFKGLVHVGSELKRRKNTNPHPKNPDKTHYREI